MNLYDLNNITVKLRSKRGLETCVFDSYSLVVSEGEFVAIVGPSGSGKSTLLGVLQGYVRPCEGVVLFKGRDMTSFSEAELMAYRNSAVGMVFQSYNLVRDMTALENIALPAMIGGTPRKDALRRAEELLVEVGLKAKAKSLAFELSGGEQQRVAIARALVNSPEVILADEPTGNLDRKASETICDLLKRIFEEHGTTILLVTHDEEVAAIAQRTINLGAA